MGVSTLAKPIFKSRAFGRNREYQAQVFVDGVRCISQWFQTRAAAQAWAERKVANNDEASDK